MPFFSPSTKGWRDKFGLGCSNGCCKIQVRKSCNAIYQHAQCVLCVHHDLGNMWLQEHYGLHRRSGYLNSGFAHKGLYAVKSTKYMQALKFKNKHNVRNHSK